MIRVLAVMTLAAGCSSSTSAQGDANNGDGGFLACDPLAQTGCMPAEKCTWILDAIQPDNKTLGHVGCAPDTGTVVDGASCTYGPPGVTGYDDCLRGHLCFTPALAPEGPGVCKQICDQQGGNPTCDADHACAKYRGLLGPPNSEAGGVCDVKCDPFADNLFGKPTKTGTECADGEGCYPRFSNTLPLRSIATCEPAPNPSAYSGAPCTADNNCADANTAFANGCAPGFLPFVSDDITGTTTFECKSLCKMKDCSSAGCGTNNIDHAGASPHACNTTDSTGVFDTTATDANNGQPDGDSCFAVWRFELDKSSNTIVTSPFSDTLGVCFDHQHFHYDANHDGTTTSNEVWPACSSLPIVASDPQHPGARDFGCVSATTSGVSMTPLTVHIQRPRLPYDYVFRK